MKNFLFVFVLFWLLRLIDGSRWLNRNCVKLLCRVHSQLYSWNPKKTVLIIFWFGWLRYGVINMTQIANATHQKIIHISVSLKRPSRLQPCKKTRLPTELQSWGGVTDGIGKLVITMPTFSTSNKRMIDF